MIPDRSDSKAADSVRLVPSIVYVCKCGSRFHKIVGQDVECRSCGEVIYEASSRR